MVIGLSSRAKVQQGVCFGGNITKKRNIALVAHTITRHGLVVIEVMPSKGSHLKPYSKLTADGLRLSDKGLVRPFGRFT